MRPWEGYGVERLPNAILFAQQLEDFVRFNDVGAFQKWIEMNRLLPQQQKKLYSFAFISSRVQAPFLKGLLGLDFGFFSRF